MASTNLIQIAINAVIRPPRQHYNLEDIPLVFESGDKRFLRIPISFVNSRNQEIVGSLYHSIESDPMNSSKCVIYLHGNVSSQLEGQFLIPNICVKDIYLFCFDFAGCGNSEGEYVSLGYFEKQDIEFLMGRLNQTFDIQSFVLWGRSMGASSALLVKSPFLSGVISDSSFLFITRTIS
ncbi:Clan SC, family S9, unassigned serine peptidase [Histomonas meleagridis]|nr:Clan SC, family S9, unassigned serine peptidase [Histomonas meleagridis]